MTAPFPRTPNPSTNFVSHQNFRKEEQKMKTLKRIGTLALALVLVLALSLTVFAGGEAVTTGSITIENAKEGQTYNLYRIFDLNHTAETKEDGSDFAAYSYTVNSAWEAFFKSTDNTCFTTDASGYVIEITPAPSADDLQKFAQAALKYAADENISPIKTAIAAEDGALKIDGITVFGYYLLDSSLGTLCSLSTAKPNMTIKEKNEVPSIEKEVEEDSTNVMGKVNDADIGQIIKYETSFVVKSGAQNYKVHDKMTAGLTFVNDATNALTVKQGDTVLTAGKDYTLTTSNLADGCTFEITFVDSSLTADKTVTVTYYAKLNENALINEAVDTENNFGNINESKLSYGDQSETTWDSTRTYAWSFKIFKHNSDNKPLSGAQFRLYKHVDKEKYYLTIDSTTKALTFAAVAEGAANTSTVFTTGADGYVEISGLDADTYYLEEIKAPDGYNLLANPIEVVIDRTADSTSNTFKQTLTYRDTTAADSTTAAGNVVAVLNLTGTELPTTGGIGTTIFYVLGGVLVLGAAILLITKKRMNRAGD